MGTPLGPSLRDGKTEDLCACGPPEYRGLRRPDRSDCAGQVSGQSVTLTWGASIDANGGAVGGYNVYRSTTPNGPYTKVNTSLITDNQYTDNTVQSGTYYYVIRSVDNDGDESAATLEMTVTLGARSVGGSGASGGGGGGGGGGCFVSSML